MGLVGRALTASIWPPCLTTSVPVVALSPKIVVPASMLNVAPSSTVTMPSRVQQVSEVSVVSLVIAPAMLSSASHSGVPAPSPPPPVVEVDVEVEAPLPLEVVGAVWSSSPQASMNTGRAMKVEARAKVLRLRMRVGSP